TMRERARDRGRERGRERERGGGRGRGTGGEEGEGGGRWGGESRGERARGSERDRERGRDERGRDRPMACAKTHRRGAGGLGGMDTGTGAGVCHRSSAPCCPLGLGTRTLGAE